jgi:pimeloyl-ACP methyl ester carboxylesterase/DNA-binding winged helix-turn-helix (wHTH) protein
MERLAEDTFEFGGFRLEAVERILSRRGQMIALPPKIFDTLLLLVQNAGHVVSKEKMLAVIWEDSFVEENNLAQNISTLRRVLGETAERKFIETVPKFGYRFVADVAAPGRSNVRSEEFSRTRARVYFQELGVSQEVFSPPRSELSAGLPETHYVQNGEVNIAYQVIGSGPVDVVFVMGWVSHLEYFWKNELFASFLNHLASFSRLILFDKRGTGLSDRVPVTELPTLEQRMEDVHAVMDAVGSKRAVLIGVSEGGPMCSLFAATYPERTAALIMIGTYAKRISDSDYPWAPTLEQHGAFLELLKHEWGGPVGIEERAPSLAGDEEFRDWWATYLRMGASPGAAVALTKMNAEIDVRNVLPSIRVPTLVIHRTGDACLKVEGGRYVASRIPNSQYVELGGIDHLPFVGDQTEILDAIEEFVTSVRFAEEYDRILATVLSVKPAAEASVERMDLTDARVFFRRQLELFRGREIMHADNEMLAAFDGPARAIRCAASIVETAAAAGVELKTGLHTGECDVAGDAYTGFAVEMAKKIADESATRNILVSRTVRDLVAGSGLSFREYGKRTFPETPGEWPLFTVVTD